MHYQYLHHTVRSI